MDLLLFSVLHMNVFNFDLNMGLMGVTVHLCMISVSLSRIDLVTACTYMSSSEVNHDQLTHNHVMHVQYFHQGAFITHPDFH